MATEQVKRYFSHGHVLRAVTVLYGCGVIEEPGDQLREFDPPPVRLPTRPVQPECSRVVVVPRPRAVPAWWRHLCSHLLGVELLPVLDSPSRKKFLDSLL